MALALGMGTAKGIFTFSHPLSKNGYRQIFSFSAQEPWGCYRNSSKSQCCQESLDSVRAACATVEKGDRIGSGTLTSADRNKGQRKGATSKNIKNRQKVSNIFVRGQKTSKKHHKYFSTFIDKARAEPV